VKQALIVAAVLATRGAAVDAVKGLLR